jgi:four helix bundle protein
MQQNLRRCHNDLVLWQKSMDLAERIYRVSAAFPKHEMFGLVAQLRRAGVSIPSNIAEGSARKSTKEFIHFLHITRGSLAELETQLQLAQRIGYLAAVEVDETQRSIDEVGRMLNAVVAGLNRRLSQPPATNP